MTKVIDKAVVSVYPPENRNVLWLKETGSGVEPQVFKANSWKSAASSVNGGVLTPGTVFAVGNGNGNNVFEIFSQSTLGFFLKDEYAQYLSDMRECYDGFFEEEGYQVRILSPGELVSSEIEVGDDETVYPITIVNWNAAATVSNREYEGVLSLTVMPDEFAELHYTLDFDGMHYFDEFEESESINLRNPTFEDNHAIRDPEVEGAFDTLSFVEQKAGADKVEIKVAGKTVHLN